MFAHAGKADPVAEMASSIVDLRSILDARMAATWAGIDDIRTSAMSVSRAAGQDLACREHNDDDVEATAALAREVIRLAFLAQPNTESFSEPFFANQVRAGIRDGCADTGGTIDDAQGWVSREIGLIFELHREIQERESRLLDLLRESANEE
jgi:hypothetical protein